MNQTSALSIADRVLAEEPDPHAARSSYAVASARARAVIDDRAKASGMTTEAFLDDVDARRVERARQNAEAAALAATALAARRGVPAHSASARVVSREPAPAAAPPSRPRPDMQPGHGHSVDVDFDAAAIARTARRPAGLA